MNDRDFLIWIHYRLVEVHNEPPAMDYMWKLRSIIEATPEERLTSNICHKSIEELTNGTD